MVWDGQTLALMLGDEEKVAKVPSDGFDIGPCSGADGGLLLLPGSGVPHTFELSDLHISRYARTFGDVCVFTGLMSAGDESDLPLGVRMGALGAGCIQIVSV